MAKAEESSQAPRTSPEVDFAIDRRGLGKTENRELDDVSIDEAALLISEGGLGKDTVVEDDITGGKQ